MYMYSAITVISEKVSNMGQQWEAFSFLLPKQVTVGAARQQNDYSGQCLQLSTVQYTA